jgi:hypothetical protein
VVTSYRGKCVGEGDEDAGGEERPQAHHTTGGTETLATLGEELPGIPLSSRERGLPRVPKIVHSGKPSPSAVLALGKDLTPSVSSGFFLKKHLPRVQHSVKKFFFFYKNPLPRVLHSGKKFDFFFKKILFPECPIPSTRGRVVPLPRHSGKVFSSRVNRSYIYICLFLFRENNKLYIYR